MDMENVIKGLAGINDYFFDVYRNNTDSYKCEKAQEYSDVVIDAIALLKEQKAEYEKGFNDAMLGKQEAMYEGIDGKWHKKDW